MVIYFNKDYVADFSFCKGTNIEGWVYGGGGRWK
jgi:hypothetical protein